MKGLSLKGKLICSFGVMALLPLAIGLFTYIQVQRLTTANRVSDRLGQAHVELLNARRHEKNYFLRKEAQYLDKVKGHVEAIQTILQKEVPLEALSPEGQKLLTAAAENSSQYQAAFLQQVESDKNGGGAVQELEKPVVAAARLIESNIVTINQQMDARIASVNSQIRIGNILATCGGFVLSLGFGLSMAVWLSGRISEVECSLDGASTQTSDAAHEVSEASQQLAQGASEQAASLQETSASIVHISSSIRSTAENAHRVKESTTETRQVAEKNSQDMEHLHSRLADLTTSSRQMTSAMEEIKVSSDSIAKIIKTIDEIAFQTNILALNAAVEAARAGESGMGFAVVADEVRNLAKRSAEAARETSTLIENAIHKSDAGVRVNEEINKVLTEVDAVADRVKSGLVAITGKVESVDESMVLIVNAAKEQDQGMHEIGNAMGQLEKVTQINAAGAEESASAAQELNAQAEELKSLSAQLELIVKGYVEPRAKSSSLTTSVKKISTRTTTPVVTRGPSHDTRSARQEESFHELS